LTGLQFAVVLAGKWLFTVLKDAMCAFLSGKTHRESACTGFGVLLKALD
jgi:hypothetical protein